MNQVIAHWLSRSAIVTALILVGAAASHPVAPPAPRTPHAEATVPRDVLCWQTEGTEFAGYTPAHILESGVIADMVHRFAATQVCRGFVNGRFTEWHAEQVWVARGGDHYPRLHE
jgi:hypothetical protein